MTLIMALIQILLSKRKVKKTKGERSNINKHNSVDSLKNALPSDIIMFSGCADNQTSSDVANTIGAFKIPKNYGPGGAGGACTNAIIETLSTLPSNKPMPSYINLLDSMHKVLKAKGFQQLPELSASRKLDLHKRMKLVQEGGSGRTRALLIGINYVGLGSGVELKGCHNDVRKIKQYICSQGFDDGQDCVKVLMDEAGYESPTKANMMKAFKWLQQGAQLGDSLFFHFSGHGGSIEDDNGDEADGMDETLIPLDYKTSGQIRDDTIYKELLVPLPAGCQLISIMDCCHSGSVFDLPYMFVANEGNLVDTEHAQMKVNPEFNVEFILTMARQLFEHIENIRVDAERSGRSLLGIAKDMLTKSIAGSVELGVSTLLLAFLLKNKLKKPPN